MSDQERSSDADEGGDDSSQEDMFSCRKCPGKTFTSAERDVHRQWHRDQRDATHRPGPRSRRRRPSPTRTDLTNVTLFRSVSAIPGRAQAQGAAKKVTTKKRKSGRLTSQKKKIKSKKNYDTSVEAVRNKGA